MSVLDKFYILFGSNAKEVQKDEKDLGKSTDELQKKINETDTITSKLANSLLTVAASGIAAFATFDGLKNGIEMAADYNAELYRQEKLTGENARSLAIWDSVFEKSTGKRGEFLSWFGQYAQFLRDSGRDTSKILPNLRELADILQKLPDAEARNYFNNVQRATGLPNDFYIQLRQGGAILDALIATQERLIGVTEKSTQVANEFARSWGQTKDSFVTIFTDIGNIVLPILTKIMNVFNAVLLIQRTLGKMINGSPVPDISLSDTKTGDFATGIVLPGNVHDDLVSSAKNGLTSADQSILNLPLPAGSDSTQNSVNIGSVTIQTQATDPEGIARALNEEMNRHFRTTIGNYDNGIAR